MLYIVRTPDGTPFCENDSLTRCRVAADSLGVGASIEEGGNDLLPAGTVIYRVTPESLLPDYDLFND